MSSTKEYKDYILEQLRDVDNVSYRPMMGEFLLYLDGILFGGIYDDRLLVKKVESNKKYNMQLEVPYDGAKPMYLVDDVDKPFSEKSWFDSTFRFCEKLNKKDPTSWDLFESEYINVYK